MSEIDLNTRSLTHPVWDVYDDYRSSRLSEEYALIRLDALEKTNFSIEIFAAISAPTSVFASWGIWKTNPGSQLWQAIAAIAFIIGISRQLWKIPTKIKDYEKHLTETRIVANEFESLVRKINQNQKYEADEKTEYSRIIKMRSDHQISAPKERINHKLRRKIQSQINKELPAKQFFVPTRSN
jgi:hypothetical protein